MSFDKQELTDDADHTAPVAPENKADEPLLHEDVAQNGVPDLPGEDEEPLDLPREASGAEGDTAEDSHTPDVEENAYASGRAHTEDEFRTDADPSGAPAFIVEEAHGGTYTQDNSQYMFFSPTLEQAQKPEEEYSLVELSTRLPTRGGNYDNLVAYELPAYLNSLKDDGIVFISCADDDIALDAAYALVEGLNLPGAEQKFLLDFGRAAAREGATPDIFLLKKEGDTDDPVAVVIDAISEDARPFLDSLIFATRASFVTIQDDLRRSGVYLICLVDAAYLENRLKAMRAEQRRTRELMFAHWQIPFLRPLLTRYFPTQHTELELRIEEQRRLGWWSRAENDFCDELKTHLKVGQTHLLEVVASREGEPDPEPASKLFRGDDPLHDTVLYVATFFQNLNPREFNQLVNLLLDNAVQGAAVDASDLKDAWRKSPDKVLSACYLVSVSLDGTTTFIGFDNFRRKDALREHLETHYSLFLDNQFERVMQLGLLFNPSRRIAEGAMRLIVKMASDCPEVYHGAWLAEQVRRFERAALGGNGGAGDPAQSARVAPEAAEIVRVRRLIYSRTAELALMMLEPGRLEEMVNALRLEEMVDAFLQQLIYTKKFRHLMEIVKRLQAAPNFDQFKWLRQLIERGDEETRGQVYNHLFGLMRKVRTRIYEILKALETWVANPEKVPLSVVNKFPLMLLLDYCFWTGRKFDVLLPEAGTSRHPLFTFNDFETARANLNLLTQWLFHPGMKTIIKGLPGWKLSQNSIDDILKRWIFVLMQREDEPDTLTHGEAFARETVPPAPVERVDTVAVCDLLLERIAANSNPAQQLALLDYWTDGRVLLLDKIGSAPRGTAERKALVRRREALTRAIAKFKAIRARASLRGVPSLKVESGL